MKKQSNLKSSWVLVLLTFLIVFGTSSNLFSQVTTASISGTVLDNQKQAVFGATVKAVHVSSGTIYGSVTNESGHYVIPAVRVGGPFTVTVSFVGYQEKSLENIYTNLGTTTNANFQIQGSGLNIDEVSIISKRNDIFSSSRTGASSTFDKSLVTTLPTIGSRSINDITKYNPNGNGKSFGGQDTRLNNFTIDGSVFNNGFGLGTDAQAGGRTGSTAISLDAIEEVQVNVAPFDVRQTGFVGSGINAVTRSGTNEFSGSAYYNFRNNGKSFFGTEAKSKAVIVPKFDEKVTGIRIGGPIIKNKLFFFLSGEMVRRTEPATTWVALRDSGQVQPDGQITRVKYTDMVTVKDTLKSLFGYDTGAFENYNNETTSDKFLVRIDYNINQSNKLTLRYTHHNSQADQLISNSNSSGNGNRRTLFEAMSFQNSGYLIGDNTRSIVAELNSTFGSKFHNTFSAGYDYQNENRKYKGALFPTIDILDGSGKTYISAGFDPFTPDNKLDYGTTHFTDNLSVYLNKHTITLGANYESYKSNNLFFPSSNGVYVFNTLADFYKTISSTADTSPVKLNRFQYRYSALPNGEAPLQVLKVSKFDIYGQDAYQITNNFNFTYGLRASYISFSQTGLENPTISNQNYIDLEGNKNYKINTSKLPDAKILWEPRLGFNWDVMGQKNMQIRGGVGIFTSRPPYVWISNQIGNNGVLTGFIDAANTTKYKFSPDANVFRPENPTLPSTFDIAATDNEYKFPQVLKSNLAIDRKLPFGFIASVEVLFNQNINAVRYFDANMEPALDTLKFGGEDNRPRFPGSGAANVNNAVRINDNVSRAAIMTTTNEGSYFGATFKLEYPTSKGLYGMMAYTVSQSQDLMSAGSIASGSYTGARSVRGNNNLDLAYSDNDIPERFIGLLGYKFEYGGKFGGATGISLGYVGQKSNRFSYRIGGDMNGDGIAGNDLLYIPKSGSNLAFEDFTVTFKDGTKKTYTAADQQTAFNNFVDQDKYLSTRKGDYAERNGAIYPWLHSFDLSVTQEFFVNVGGKRNTIQFRADILNFGNLLNKNWGVGNRIYTDQPISFRKLSSSNEPIYRMATQLNDEGNQILLKDTFTSSNSLSDVWSAQFGIRYIFN